MCIRDRCTALMEQCTGVCAAFSGTDAGGYKYALGSAGGADVHALCTEMNAALGGRGGGRAMQQGSAACTRGDIAVSYTHLDVYKRQALYHSRYGILRKAFARFSTWYPDDYCRCCYEQGWWLEDYALYMTAKGLYEGKSYLCLLYTSNPSKHSCFWGATSPNSL